MNLHPRPFARLFRSALVIIGLFLIFVPPASSTLGAAIGDSLWGPIHAIWKTASGQLELRNWTFQDFSQFKRQSSNELDPSSGKIIRWTGVLLSDLIQKAIDKLTIEQRAQIDLVILKNKEGHQALVPRSMVIKYPIMVGWTGEDAPTVVIPWTSKPKITNEDLPLESYFVKNVSEVELGNYQDRFGNLFLKRRTDPGAIRGEKIYVHNCVSCHAGGSGSAAAGLNGEKARSLASSEHPPVKGGPKLSPRDRRSLVNYLDAYRNENHGEIGLMGRMPNSEDSVDKIPPSNLGRR